MTSKTASLICTAIVAIAVVGVPFDAAAKNWPLGLDFTLTVDDHTPPHDYHATGTFTGAAYLSGYSGTATMTFRIPPRGPRHSTFHGILTLDNSVSTIVLNLDGRADPRTGGDYTVAGSFNVLSGTGAYAGLSASGKFTLEITGLVDTSGTIECLTWAGRGHTD